MRTQSYRAGQSKRLPFAGAPKRWMAFKTARVCLRAHCNHKWNSIFGQGASYLAGRPVDVAQLVHHVGRLFLASQTTRRAATRREVSRKWPPEGRTKATKAAINNEGDHFELLKIHPTARLTARLGLLADLICGAQRVASLWPPHRDTYSCRR